jgi:mitogen-activated protein kinase kinase
MLLKHPWLKSLAQPQTITEEAEEGEEADQVAEAVGKIELNPTAGDPEVAEWVNSVLKGNSTDPERRPSRPALHAAPLDSVSPNAA